jgi:transposase-like protein
MEKKIKNCPICNSENIIIENEVNEISVPYGNSQKYTEEYIKCLDCEESINIESMANSEIEKARRLSEGDSINKILDFLQSEGYSMTSIERALELPSRTLYRMKSTKEFSAASLALLRYLRTYPWLIKVAENKYDSNYAKIILMENSFRTFSGFFSEFSKTYDVKSSVDLNLSKNHAQVSISLEANKFDVSVMGNNASILTR